jgi:N-methylhydantoinase A/oxoprolinase/acetone carboxylase beta subunit
MPELRIGVSHGETTTDAVALDARDRVLATVRVETTGAVRDDISRAIRAIVADDAVDPAAVRWVMLDAGHVLEDVAVLPGVRRVAIVRIGGPLTTSVPPLATWPPELRAAVSAGETIVAGGSEYDGRADVALDEDAIARFLAGVGNRAQAVAISGVFAPASPAHELAAARIARRELGISVHVSLSHEIGSIGLLERENATVLNAALGGAAEQLAAATHTTLLAVGIDAELLFAQNDGTLMAVAHADRFPALMIASGPGTMIVGAAHLSGVGDAVVAAIGSTRTYVGALVNGIPRVHTGPTDIAGVRTSLRLPDARGVDIGTSSIATASNTDDAAAPVEPENASTSQRLAFVRALMSADRALADALSEARVARPVMPLVVVGPGQRLVPDQLDGVSEVIRPRDGEFAHAIGAAVASVSGQFARICLDRPDTRRFALEDVRAAAIARAIDAGAHPDRVVVVEVDEAPLMHLVQPALRIRVRAAGPCW